MRDIEWLFVGPQTQRGFIQSDSNPEIISPIFSENSQREGDKMLSPPLSVEDAQDSIKDCQKVALVKCDCDALHDEPDKNE